MNINKRLQKPMRILHRYMGFLLIVVMMVYAISGVVLLYRDTPIFKKEVHVEKEIEPNIPIDELGRKLRIRDFKPLKIENDIVYFQQGTYNSKTGMANYDTQDYPWLLKQFNSLHLANSQHRYSWFALLFGIALFLFSISSFWMFPTHSKIFKRGAWFMLAGAILGIIVVFF